MAPKASKKIEATTDHELTDIVELRFPGIDDDAEPFSTTFEAFQTVWEPKGWILADETPETASDPADSGSTEGN